MGIAVGGRSLAVGAGVGVGGGTPAGSEASWTLHATNCDPALTQPSRPFETTCTSIHCPVGKPRATKEMGRSSVSRASPASGGA